MALNDRQIRILSEKSCHNHLFIFFQSTTALLARDLTDATGQMQCLDDATGRFYHNKLLSVQIPMFPLLILSSSSLTISLTTWYAGESLYIVQTLHAPILTLDRHLCRYVSGWVILTNVDHCNFIINVTNATAVLCGTIGHRKVSTLNMCPLFRWHLIRGNQNLQH